MMHYGFCRKHADQMGEGGCPECAMDHQQAEILELRAKLQKAEAERDTALEMIACWCVSIELNGTGWDDWDEYYKDAAYRPGPLRELLDAEILKRKASPEWER